MNKIFGMSVRTSALVNPVPVLQLSQASRSFTTDEFRGKFNQYLLEMFGTKNVAYMIGNNELVLNHHMLMELKRKLNNGHAF